MMDWEADERLRGVYLLLSAVAKVLVDLDANQRDRSLSDVPSRVASAVNARLLAEQSPSDVRSALRALRCRSIHRAQYSRESSRIRNCSDVEEDRNCHWSTGQAGSASPETMNND